ncbi:MAG: hypothetical protein ABL886_04715 [Rhodoglobus sp.]
MTGRRGTSGDVRVAQHTDAAARPMTQAQRPPGGRTRARRPQPAATPVQRTQVNAIRGPTHDLIFLDYHNFRHDYGIQDLVYYLRGTKDEMQIDLGTDRLGARNLDVKIYQDARTLAFKADLQRALQIDGAVVCYHGHAVFNNKRLERVTGLSANPEPPRAPDFTNAQLQFLAGRARAKVFLIIGCSSSDIVPRRLANDTAIVTFFAGRDRVVDGTYSGQAMQNFYQEFLFSRSPSSVADAVRAANDYFASKRMEEHLVMASGDGTMTRDGSPERGQ